MTRRSVLVLAVALLLGAAIVAGMAAFRQVSAVASEQQTLWAIARVDRELFNGFPTLGSNCFALHVGHSEDRVFVVDASYSDYWDVRCDTRATRAGRDLLLEITQSWDAASPPDSTTLWGWMQRLFYRSPSHTWSFRVHPNGSVMTLPERGEPTPQSYSH